MRVALSFPGCHRRGGVERVLVECANGLNARGHETHVFASEWDPSALDARVIRHPVSCDMRAPLLRLLSYDRNSRNAINGMTERPDVHCGFGVLAVTGAVVWTQSVHGAWLEISQTQRTWRGRLLQRCNPIHPVIRRMERRYFGGRKYGKLIALSDQVKNDLMRLYNVPENDIVILPNGYASAEFNTVRCSEMRDEMRQRLGYDDSARVIAFVANELERKGFWQLVQAISQLNDARIHLLVVGRVPPGAYSSEIRALGLFERVRFVGPTADVAMYYAAADVFALPTQYEAWGLVIVEAMACGLPVLTSRLAGAAIAVREGDTGELLDGPRDVSEIAAKLDVLLKRVSTAGDGYAEHIEDSVAEFEWSKIVRRYESILAQVAA